MKKIGIILNPSARINSKKTAAVIKKLEDIFVGSALLRTTRNKEDIPGVMDEFRNEGVKLLLISGGDGTICNVLSTYIKLFGADNLPVILPLMGGTINMIGSDAGLRNSQFAICRRLNDIVKRGEPVKVVERGLLRINDSALSEPYYGFSWIDGFLYRFLIGYYKQGAGIQVASVMTIKTILTLLSNGDSSMFKDIDSTVYADGKKLPHDGHVMIIASCLKKLVFGFDIFADKSVPGRSFNMVYVREAYIRKERHKLPLGLYMSLKSDIDGNFVNSAVNTLRVERNKGYIIDGEIFTSDEHRDVLIEAGPVVRIFSFRGDKDVEIKQ
ncbi:MAG: diacylglycerol kinase family protein [Thermodesulfobacteriota bacterium]